MSQDAQRSDALLEALRIPRGPSGRAPRKRRLPWWLLVLVALVIGFFALRALQPVEVETGNARSAADAGPTSLLDASGFVTPRRIATVSSKVTGRVLEVLIEEGQRVAEDELLARLDPVDANAQLELSRAQLASSRSQLAEARTQLALAESTLKRQQELAARKLTSDAALEQAQSERDARVARLSSLQRASEVAVEQFAVAELNVTNTEVRAPFAGVIIAKAAQPGEMVSPLSAGGGFTRTGIGTLVDMDSLEVNVDVNEAYIGRVQPGMPVDAVLNAYPDWKIPGSVIAIVPTADRSKATVKVRIALDSRDPRIVPDMGVRVSFLEARLDPNAPPAQGALVPERAVVIAVAPEAGASAERGHVFVLGEDDVARRVEVQLGDAAGGERRVLSGLAGGESLVLSPPETLQDGDRVKRKTSR
jgi:RND family efflux transporter MFP subunit